jgi:hypothetical protein
MKIHIDHAQFVQDLVLRITSNPEFNATEANIAKACEHAFAVGRKFFDAYDAEAAALKAIDDKPKPSEKKPVAEKRAVRKADAKA